MKISIITVVKNGLPFLKSAIKSIKDQKNIKDVEHIVVYSPSNDGTEKYLNSLSNIVNVVFDNISENKFGSINKGIKLATGDIIGLLHADDIFYDQFTLSDILREFKDGSDIVYGNILFCEKKNISKIIREWHSSKFDKKMLLYGWMPPHTSLFIKKEILQSNLYDENFPISGDYYFILKLFNKQNLKIKFLNRYIAIMRSGGDSTNFKNLFKKFIEDMSIARKFFKFPFFVILFKIFTKINQFKFYKKKLENKYIDDLNIIN